jgi:hypothetical protein
MDAGTILFILAVIAVASTVAYFSHLREKQRREALAAVARKLGFSFRPAKDRDLAKRFAFLDRLGKGSQRHAFHVFRRDEGDEDVLIFDYHYATHSTDSKGRRTTHHHYLGVYLWWLPASFPEVTIRPEGLFSKVAQAFGYDDIDFESHEFSKRFCVRSRDKKLAYDVCNGSMIEYFLENRDLTLEIEGRALALIFDGRLSPEKVAYNFERLKAVRSRLPDYLFETT